MTAWLSLALSLVAVAVGMLVMRRMIDRRAGADAVMEEIRREIGAILTEMNQTTERNVELLEDGIGRLQDVMAQADRRLGVLKRESLKQETAGSVYSHLSGAARMVPPVATPAAIPAAGSDAGDERDVGDERAAEDSRNAPAVTGTPAPAPEARNAETPAGSPVPAETSAPSADDLPLKERVLGLYRQGIPIDRIASRVGTAVSEIELIVSLSERR